VIHLDTGWFEPDWRCDYKFSTTRLKDPAKMIADLKQDGFHLSLWQLPYFVPQMFETGTTGRDVYLPQGQWIDYQSGKLYPAGAQSAQGLVCLPSDNVLHKVEAARRGNAFALASDPLAGKATSAVRLYSAEKTR